MKRTNSVADALNADAADIDLGDGLSATLPLGNMVEVIGDAAVEASSGPKVIALDTDGVPYYSRDAGTHRIFRESDGSVYFGTNQPFPELTLEPDGVPALALEPVTNWTEAESDGRYARLGHTHTTADVTGLAAALAAKAEAKHSHAAGDVSGLTEALATKAGSSHSHAVSEVAGLPEALAGKASAIHAHKTADVAGLVDALAAPIPWGRLTGAPEGAAQALAGVFDRAGAAAAAESAAKTHANQLAYGSTLDTTDATIASLAANPATATGARLASKVGRGELVYNVNDFAGADGIARINAAITMAAGSFGQGGVDVFVPPGVYDGAGDILLANNVRLRGSGQSSIIRIAPGNKTKNTLIRRTSGPWIGNIQITDLRFEGRWEEFQSQVLDNGLLTLKYVRGLRIERCYFKNSRAFSLNVNDCDDVTVNDCRFENGARDFIAVWGTPRVSITNNKLAHNDDDAISVNVEATGLTAPTRTQIVITGNHLSDTGPIRTQAPMGVIITGNTLERTRGMGILLGVLNTALADTSTGHSNIIQGNVIRDVLDRQWNVNGTPASVNLRSYILVESVAPQTGGLTAVPGQINSATGTAVAPYAYNYSHATVAGNAGPLRMPHGVLVAGNICKRTLPAVAAYSDWGYGAGFSMDGWRDFAVSDETLRGCGVRLVLPLQSVVVEGNILEAGRWGVYFSLAAGVSNSHRLAQGVRIRNNEIRDFDAIGIGWDQSILTHQDVTVEGNQMDGDPNFLSKDRVSGGAWSASSATPIAIKLPFMGGAVIARNTVRNVGAAIDQLGAAAIQDVEDNLVIADPASSGFNAANKGVGSMPAIGNGGQWWLLARDCDPTSPTYGHSLGGTPRNASSQPTAGKWLGGMVVYSRTSGVVDGKVLLGWLRLTTGTSHVAGTDWVPMYAATS